MARTDRIDNKTFLTESVDALHMFFLLVDGAALRHLVARSDSVRTTSMVGVFVIDLNAWRLGLFATEQKAGQGR